MFTARDFNEIIPSLYLGSVFAASSSDTLEELGITHVLTMGKDMSPKFPDRYEYKVWELEDEVDEDIKKYFEEGIEFIDTALSSGGNIFVHWAAGISRSTSMVCAYLMKSNKWKFKKSTNSCYFKKKICMSKFRFSRTTIRIWKGNRFWRNILNSILILQILYLIFLIIISFDYCP